MSRFVRYEEFGGPEVLKLIEVQPPTAGPGQVRVHVRVAGLNPVDWKIFTGPAAPAYGSALPMGIGNDFSGVIDQVGDGVTDWKLGDEVFGGARNLAGADYIVHDADASLVRKPAGLDFDVAGSLDVAGKTAAASVDSLSLTDADTVLVSAAAGGVGVLASQLALRTGATVIGTASESNHDFLRSLGVIPVTYGDGLVDRVRAVAPQGITAVLDNQGGPTIAAGVELGVQQARINTIAYHGSEFADVRHVGGAEAKADDLARVAQLLADGEIVLPIDSAYPLERVAEAYERLMTGHLRGKIVLTLD
ncbi:NADP-dependent oxidoreductase [Leifsonia sp. Root112D2]|uniref:NADP-dependent oxidoreductase n=1 Tax=Leifsonia sp. Root112D2 TaxID=1736426 RepID=UPI0006FC68AC|nr:NADP-dependent oxidoreductase [Leifsonia sp. Root112D2]KQV05158.1 hypothetical protein ASC63_15320 [Leifsonia sp. Root112D2]